MICFVYCSFIFGCWVEVFLGFVDIFQDRFFMIQLFNDIDCLLILCIDWICEEVVEIYCVLFNDFIFVV